jgi:hypothetical protein
VPEEKREVRVSIGYPITEANLFHRDQPARDECPPEFWDIARKIVDHGGALLLTENKVGSDRNIRDLVTAALLRRALIITEGVVTLLAHGLMEPAVALGRVLLDIELNFKLVTADSTQRMAKRLAAYHFMAGQRHGQKMLTNRESRERMASVGDGQLEWMKEVSKSLAKDFESPAFDDVRAGVRPGQPWHGMNVEEAFKFAGLSVDYYQTYNLQTFFVHTSNIDFVSRPGQATDRPCGHWLSATQRVYVTFWVCVLCECFT